LDLAAKMVTIRERKRVKGRGTTRRVPLSPFLIGVLKKWLEIHPGGQYLFCHAAVVDRSNKRSRMTGYKGQKTRPKTVHGRLETVQQRGKVEISQLTPDEAHDHLKRTLFDSRWEHVRGYHTLRHSFISALASREVDQRLIDEFVGHQSEEQRRRYRHIYPSVKDQAIAKVFGKS
jgi:integrase